VVAHHRADLARTGITGDEIRLVELDPVETGPGNGGQLGPELARDRGGGDGGLHGRSSAWHHVGSAFARHRQQDRNGEE